MPSDLPAAEVAFIDGDHGREGVVNDTSLAYARVKRGLVIWHDYHALRDQNGPLVDVASVLHSLHDQGHDIKHVEGTWLAFETIGW